MATVIDGGGRVNAGAKKPVTFMPCGQDCTLTFLMLPGSTDLHLKGSTWTGTYGETESFGPCTITIDANSLDTIEDCPSFGLNVHYGATKNG
jgi:hypothetical protein